MESCNKGKWKICDCMPMTATEAERDLHMAHMLYKYIETAMSEAIYEEIDHGEYSGKIPCCWGAIAFAPTLEECKDELLSVLEDWILVGLIYGHPLPIM